MQWSLNDINPSDCGWSEKELYDFQCNLDLSDYVDPDEFSEYFDNYNRKVS